MDAGSTKAKFKWVKRSSIENHDMPFFNYALLYDESIRTLNEAKPAFITNILVLILRHLKLAPVLCTTVSPGRDWQKHSWRRRFRWLQIRMRWDYLFMYSVLSLFITCLHEPPSKEGAKRSHSTRSNTRENFHWSRADKKRAKVKPWQHNLSKSTN